tara:strand:- start:250 stop:387 length:138 start_codon:yes stop_codon:yes gene_type:complete
MRITKRAGKRKKRIRMQATLDDHFEKQEIYSKKLIINFTYLIRVP